jgi:hypothetical protein
MKLTKSFIVFFAAYLISYLVFSAIGCLFFKPNLQHYTYSEVVGNIAWFVIYNLFIGWWIGAIIAHEYYEEQCRKERNF